MAANELGELRRSQVVTTYGPGAIVDFRAGGYGGGPVSVVAAGLDAWDEHAAAPNQTGIQHPQTIREPRLQEVLSRHLGTRIEGFRLPPAVPSENGEYTSRERLVGVRFPQRLQCPGCGRLQWAANWNSDPGDPAPYCADCSHERGARVHVVPVRFIVACEKGHLGEFPWHQWVGHRPDCPNRDGPLYISTEGAGLIALILSCKRCKARRSMDGCLNRDALAALGVKCGGHRHWLGDNEECDCAPRGVLRGATNVYFPVTLSSLDIPPWSGQLQQRIPPLDWQRLREGPDDAFRLVYITAARLDQTLGLPPGEILNRLTGLFARLEGVNEGNLRQEEYDRLVEAGTALDVEPGEFEAHPETVPAELAHHFSRVVRVTRLREVRAITSFTRLRPPADWRTSGEDTPLARLSLTPKNWLPAVEVRGEGIFLELKRERLKAWLESPVGDVIRGRANEVDAAFQADLRERYGKDAPARRITPRLLLIHSLAHALIRQLSLDCGYTTASLRERLYVAEGEQDMCGLLIYTATPDADGTLGGLCRQARAANLVRLVERALAACAWCSSDPLCVEGRHARSEATNRAACHACMLVPETSCEEFNRLLDRALLVGLPVPAGNTGPDLRQVGYFHGLLGLRQGVA
jgi:hypothetical protein